MLLRATRLEASSTATGAAATRAAKREKRVLAANEVFMLDSSIVGFCARGET